MKIKDVMTRGVESVTPDTSLQEAASRMKSLDVGPLPVCDEGRVLGIVTDRDLVVRGMADGRDPRTTPVREVMTKDVATCREDDDVKDAARTMKDRQVRRVLVTAGDGRLSGIVSLGDIAVDTRDDKLKGDVLEKVSESAETVGKR